MLIKNNSGQGIFLYSLNTTTTPYSGMTGDAANVTGKYSLDGAALVAGFATAHPTEIGSGVYWQPLAAAETNANQVAYLWSSTTAGVYIAPVIVQTSGYLANLIIPLTGNTANSFLDCLNAARAQGFGKWVISGTTLTLYGSDGSTVVRTFTFDNAATPTQRT
jgi:hypothetical protein